jgi:hypothetical protein
MSNPDFESTDNEWDERRDLAWDEGDWEHYLRAQDETIARYLELHENLAHHPERIDQVAHEMGWDEDDWSADAGGTDDGPDEDDDDPYTLQKNPIFIATRAIHLRLERDWQRIARDPAQVPQGLALGFQAALNREEFQALLAIQALDFGDYALSISLFLRALRELNGSLALLSVAAAPDSPLARFRELAEPCLFDLREIWLRVMAECRDELEQPPDADDD